jgi:diguanylate cyclase (GGDEF)-like protein
MSRHPGDADSDAAANRMTPGRNPETMDLSATSNDWLSAPPEDGLSARFLDSMNHGLLEVLREIETSLDGEPKADQLREVRALLIKAAHSIMMQSDVLSELHQLALTDELTGLYNRRGFLALGLQQLKLSRRTGEPLLLFFADLDHLKRTNDLYGHDEGDALLRRCAAALKHTFRESDIVARLGGDEFAILAVEYAGRSCEGILRRLRDATGELNAAAEIAPLSMSVGVARFNPQAPVSLAALLAAADTNMYQNKRAGQPTSPASDSAAVG